MMQSMMAARLYGPGDLRMEHIPVPHAPRTGEVIIKVETVGICGSDLHAFQDARIGDTDFAEPLVIGHEFSGIVEDVGSEALDGLGNPLRPGIRVAVDPAQPCFRCHMCEQGQPNLCHRLHFCGVFPDPGPLAEYIRIAARSCFPLPDELDAEEGALLEPLGVAFHAVDLVNAKLGECVVIHGAGAVGLMILQLIQRSGVDRVYVIDQFPWRLDLARELGAFRTINFRNENPVNILQEETHGHGAEICIEAAWCDHSVNEGILMAAPAGRVLLVGISSQNRIQFNHASARRKELKILMSRRMKHAYPRCLRLAQCHQVELKGLVSHRFPLKKTPEAFRMNLDYADQVNKVMIRI